MHTEAWVGFKGYRDELHDVLLLNMLNNWTNWTLLFSWKQNTDHSKCLLVIKKSIKPCIVNKIILGCVI